MASNLGLGRANMQHLEKHAMIHAIQLVNLELWLLTLLSRCEIKRLPMKRGSKLC